MARKLAIILLLLAGCGPAGPQRTRLTHTTKDAKTISIVMEHREEGPVAIVHGTGVTPPMEIRFTGDMAKEALAVKPGETIIMTGIIQDIDERGVVLGEGHIYPADAAPEPQEPWPTK